LLIGLQNRTGVISLFIKV